MFSRPVVNKKLASLLFFSSGYHGLEVGHSSMLVGPHASACIPSVCCNKKNPKQGNDSLWPLIDSDCSVVAKEIVISGLSLTSGGRASKTSNDMEAFTLGLCKEVSPGYWNVKVSCLETMQHIL